MPKLKCPTEAEVQAAIDSLWCNVDEDYIKVHAESAKWSQLSMDKSRQYAEDCRKRAKAIIKWVRYQCAANDIVYSFTEYVHLIDHSVKPPSVAPYVKFLVWVKEYNWLKLEVLFFKPQHFSEIESQFQTVVKALSAIRKNNN